MALTCLYAAKALMIMLQKLRFQIGLSARLDVRARTGRAICASLLSTGLEIVDRDGRKKANLPSPIGNRCSMKLEAVMDHDVVDGLS